jgi:predicted NBD/HSP70 family sugar kinase
MAARVRNVEPDAINGEDVFRWIDEGDEAVGNVLDQFTRPIARMIMNLQFIYDPERFAIGGGISRQPRLLQSIRSNLDQFYSIYPVKVPRADVTVCRFFNEANLMGAYQNYLRTFGK